jgi:hypothetical protein
MSAQTEADRIAAAVASVVKSLLEGGVAPGRWWFLRGSFVFMLGTLVVILGVWVVFAYGSVWLYRHSSCTAAINNLQMTADEIAGTTARLPSKIIPYLEETLSGTPVEDAVNYAKNVVATLKEDAAASVANANLLLTRVATTKSSCIYSEATAESPS